MSSSPRRRTLLPERLLLPPGPRDPQLRARFDALPFEQRRRLAVAAVRGDDEPGDLQLVRALAEARLTTWWRPQLAALVLGWLVLMTLWGFGRSTYPAQEPSWLAAGLLAGGVAWLIAAVAARRRVARARDLVRERR